MAQNSARDLLLLCRSEYEIKRMREYVKKHPNSDMTANSFFLQLSADCLRYREALVKAGINIHNINNGINRKIHCKWTDAHRSPRKSGGNRNVKR